MPSSALLISSVILYSARGKDFLEWETINKLCEKNGDFAKFVEGVKIDFESKRIHKSENDEIPKDTEKYTAEKLGIEQSGSDTTSKQDQLIF